MKKIFEDYCKIYEYYPNNIPLNKKQKKDKHQLLMRWKKTDYIDEPNYMETLNFMYEYKSIPYHVPFFQKVLIPPLAQEVLKHQMAGLKSYFELIGNNDFGICHTIQRDPLFLLEEELHFKINSFHLANMVLDSFPNHLPTLFYKYKQYKKILSFSVHEVPCGILCGMNGADLDGLIALNKDLQEFEKLSKQLEKYMEDKEFITYCAQMYQAYKHYLLNMKMYYDFKECLEHYTYPVIPQ